MYGILQEKYYNIVKSVKYLVQTQSQAKSSGIILPEVHGINKGLDTNKQLEKQIGKPLFKERLQAKPRIGHSRAGSRGKKPPINQPTAQSAENLKIPVLPKIPMEVINMPNFITPAQSISNPSMEAINRRMMQQISKDIPFYSDPVYQPPPKPVEIPMSKTPENMDINLELNTDFEENLPFQEGVISEAYQRPDKSFFQEPQELDSLVNTGRLVQKFLPKQADIDKILKVIHKKVLNGTHLPVTMMEIQA